MLRSARFLVLVLALLASGCPRSGSSSTVSKVPGQPDVHVVEGDDLRLSEAVQTARDSVQTFVDAVRTADGSRQMTFKARFESDGEVEHMWVREVRVVEGQLVGVLDNEPTAVTGLKVGDEVRRAPGEVTDWMIVKDGKVTGGYTIRALRAGMTDADRNEFDAYSDYDFD